MYFCYLDESGTPESGGTSHFVLVGLAIPCEQWKSIESTIRDIKKRFGLEDSEIHTAWMVRRYVEQEAVSGFESLNHDDRRSQAKTLRDGRLLRIAASGNKKQLKAAKLNCRKTDAYLHLTRNERCDLLRQLADCLSGWADARLFAQAIDLTYLESQPQRAQPPYEYAFTELVQRFEYFLANHGRSLSQDLRGLIVQDNNDTVARKITQMMQRFHREGTQLTSINQIVETPFFVDSQLTSMVQIADLCGYAVRRYFENHETDLFDRIYNRFDRRNHDVVGIHHFTSPTCDCRVCKKS